MSDRWYVLGFTSDAIVGALQDSRNVETSGEGDHIIHWYVNEAAAVVLDERHVLWRSLLVGERPGPPPRGRELIDRTHEP